MAVEVGGSRGGDVAILRHSTIPLPTSSCFHITYLMDGDVSLDITHKPTLWSDDKGKICSLEPSSGWTHSDVEIPTGAYGHVLILEGHIHSPEGARIFVGSIEMLDKNCSKTSWSGKAVKVYFTNKSDMLFCCSFP